MHSKVMGIDGDVSLLRMADLHRLATGDPVLVTCS
jgi:hypothetical protein